MKSVSIITGGGSGMGLATAKMLGKLLTEGIQAELKNTHVEVILVCPGAIETDIKSLSMIHKLFPGLTSDLWPGRLRII
jgi:NAD(P)-dependent dehydrogenase (short-subunit alcohol dehydrogenase family)